MEDEGSRYSFSDNGQNVGRIYIMAHIYEELRVSSMKMENGIITRQKNMRIQNKDGEISIQENSEPEINEFRDTWTPNQPHFVTSLRNNMFEPLKKSSPYVDLTLQGFSRPSMIPMKIVRMPTPYYPTVKTRTKRRQRKSKKRKSKNQTAKNA